MSIRATPPDSDARDAHEAIVADIATRFGLKAVEITFDWTPGRSFHAVWNGGTWNGWPSVAVTVATAFDLADIAATLGADFRETTLDLRAMACAAREEANRSTPALVDLGGGFLCPWIEGEDD